MTDELNPKERAEFERIKSQINTTNQSGYAPAPISGTFGSDCPQCGLLHPPLPPGEKCPNAPIKTDDNKVIDPTKFLVDVKNILVSQIETKKIKDVNKLFSYLKIELTKLLESYKE